MGPYRKRGGVRGEVGFPCPSMVSPAWAGRAVSSPQSYEDQEEHKTQYPQLCGVLCGVEPEPGPGSSQFGGRGEGSSCVLRVTPGHARLDRDF